MLLLNYFGPQLFLMFGSVKLILIDVKQVRDGF